jgi:hypothetical protein
LDRPGEHVLVEGRARPKFEGNPAAGIGGGIRREKTPQERAIVAAGKSGLMVKIHGFEKDYWPPPRLPLELPLPRALVVLPLLTPEDIIFCCMVWARLARTFCCELLDDWLLPVPAA